MTAKRIKLERRRGWRKPPDAIVVSRPSRWANPFPVVGADRAAAIQSYRRWLDDPNAQPVRCGAKTYQRPAREAIIATLRGHDLACWCPLDQPCHADVLLELANRPTAEGHKSGTALSDHSQN
jgi:Domain of unknown function (DUF4326)